MLKTAKDIAMEKSDGLLGPEDLPTLRRKAREFLASNKTFRAPLVPYRYARSALKGARCWFGTGALYAAKDATEFWVRYFEWEKGRLTNTTLQDGNGEPYESMVFLEGEVRDVFYTNANASHKGFTDAVSEVTRRLSAKGLVKGVQATGWASNLPPAFESDLYFLVKWRGRRLILASESVFIDPEVARREPLLACLGDYEGKSLTEIEAAQWKDEEGNDLSKTQTEAGLQKQMIALLTQMEYCVDVIGGDMKRRGYCPVCKKSVHVPNYHANAKGFPDLCVSHPKWKGDPLPMCGIEVKRDKHAAIRPDQALRLAAKRSKVAWSLHMLVCILFQYEVSSGARTPTPMLEEMMMCLPTPDDPEGLSFERAMEIATKHHEREDRAHFRDALVVSEKYLEQGGTQPTLYERRGNVTS